MTEVTATREGCHYKLKVTNHANERDACVMISAIVYALAGMVNISETVDVKYIKLEKGDAEIDFLSQDELAAEDMRMAVVGLFQIQKAYPDSITIQENIF